MPYCQGFGWVDVDNDGVNDAFVDIDGDGVNDWDGHHYDDGYRPDATSTVVDDGDLLCTGAGEAQTTDPTGDCDDADPLTHPDAEERADLKDNDCDGFADEPPVDD